MSDNGNHGLGDLESLFAQEREACAVEHARLDLEARAAQAQSMAAALAQPGGVSHGGELDASDMAGEVDFDLDALFSVERAQVTQEAYAALLPTAPGLGAVAVAQGVARLSLLAKWGLGLAAAAGVAGATVVAVDWGDRPEPAQVERAVERERVDPGPELIEPPGEVERPLSDTPVEELSPIPERSASVQAPKPRKSMRGSHTKPKVALSLEDRLQALERKAQRAWKSGDLVGAERAFLAIVSLAPKSSFAQWAWGDLFVLAKRGADRGKQRKLWNRYLKAHPKGRFADAALAGLCRTGETGSQNCWRRYLRRFPDGAFVKDARKVLDG